MGVSLTSAGIGLVFAIIAGIRMWHKHGLKSNAWMMLFAGLFLSYTVVSWFGSLGGISILGASIWFVVFLVCATVSHLHVIKNKKSHVIATPLFTFFLGVSLVATFGGVQGMVGNMGTQVTSIVQKTGAR
jgi:uncharacterized membrane protein